MLDDSQFPLHSLNKYLFKLLRMPQSFIRIPEERHKTSTNRIPLTFAALS